ncbi:tRNA 2-thiouridine(34) synthase MnmA [Gottschalkiaceae bacterium SANA]|nr:tRNA 2-thiouridine(34) synthase MnmA [Gottschalkiaceae bacterium SANA]
MGKKVMIALSGGVDSAVATSILIDAGYQVEAVTMKLRPVGFEETIESAKEVADFFGIQHHVIDLSKAFESKVVAPFLEAYRKGQTPNPCLYCNPKIKYGLLMDWSINQGADYFATGHYARLKRDSNTALVHLLQASNSRKDQGYVLSRLTQAQLSRLIFPLGEFQSKEDVRKLAMDKGIPVFEKKDSTGICFIEKGDHLSYLSKFAPSTMQPGPVCHQNGKIVGRHQGLARYTIGQKKGLQQWTKGNGLVVTRMDALNNTLWLGSETDLLTEQIRFHDLQWLVPVEGKDPLDVKLCQWGHTYPVAKVEADIAILGVSARAPAPGQIIVFYRRDEVVGSAVIDR